MYEGLRQEFEMNIRRVFRKRIKRDVGNVHLDADVNAVVAGNVGERGSTSSVSSRQRIVQRAGRREENVDRPSGGEVKDDG
jgi:hypothetical protein